ncbi:hypothetical protein HY636_05135 [Candidatus Woesearchaeota archaeon]|nr:hypothetical protein [Candidatus Woesearchaeota archaeon]
MPKIKAGDTGIEVKLKRKELDKPRDYDKMLLKRSEILASSGLEIGDKLAASTLDLVSLGKIIYLTLDPFNINIWESALALTQEPFPTLQVIVNGRVNSCKKELSNIISAELSLLKIQRNSVDVTNYKKLAEQFDRLFLMLNKNRYSPAAGLIKDLTSSKISKDKELAQFVLSYLDEAAQINKEAEKRREKKKGKKTQGFRKGLDKEVNYYVACINGREDIACLAFRRKRNERIAEKLAFRISIADQVLYDFVLNKRQFDKRAEFSEKNRNNQDSEKRRIARRWMHYAKIARTTPHEKGLEELYKAVIIDDIFGNKIIVRSKEDIPNVLRAIVPLRAGNVLQIENYRHTVDKSYMESHIRGYVVQEMDNHYLQENRLSSLLQIKLRPYPDVKRDIFGKDIFEIAIQDQKSFLYDLVDSEVGHMRYENERMAAMMEMPAYLQQRFVLYYNYIMKLFETVEVKPLLELKR